MKFIHTFGSVIANSASHIYFSALPFSPKLSWISRQYTPRFSQNAKVVQGQSNTWPVLESIIKGHTGSITSVTFSPNGEHIASSSYDQTIRVWDAVTGQPVGNPLQGHSETVRSVAFSPDGKHIASGSGDQTISVWDAVTGQPVGNPLQGHSETVTSVAFSPDGKHIASGSGDQTIRVWDAVTGQPVGNPLQGHSDWVTAGAFSPDSRQAQLSKPDAGASKVFTNSKH
jgi:WD40 repeat protein